MNMDEEENSEESQRKKYVQQSKGMYIVWHAINPFLYAIFFTLIWFMASDWEKKHRN
jgi:hypothetical protein